MTVSIIDNSNSNYTIPNYFNSLITDFSKDDYTLSNNTAFYMNNKYDPVSNFSNTNTKNMVETSSNINPLTNSNSYLNISNLPKNKFYSNKDQFKKVFIGGLNYKTDDDSLRNYFSKYGQLTDCVVVRDAQLGRSRCFGFVTYSDVYMVDELMKNRPHIVDEKQVDLKRATPRDHSNKPEVQMSVKKLFIGGLKDDLSEKDLKNYFESYGSILDVVIVKDQVNSKSRGFGFVTFDDYDPVDKIILEKNHFINGININVQKALPKNVEKTNLNLRNPQDSRFLNKNFNYNNQMVNNRTSYECRNSSQLTTNEYSSGTGNYHSTNFNNLKNTYGYYNLASDSQTLNINGQHTFSGLNRSKSSSGPIRAGGRFTNRSSEPYRRINSNNS